MSRASAPTVPPTTAVRYALRATFAAFIGAGFVFASFASRIPQVRDRLDLSPSELGLVLLALAAGSLLALPLSGLIVSRLGTRRTVSSMAVLCAVGLGVIALGYLNGVVLVLVGLFLLGFGNGAWDVAMNVQGADVERQLGKAVMPRFHAGFSVGTVAGALLGAGMVAVSLSVTVHLVVVAVVVAVSVPLLVRRFLPDLADPAERAEPEHGAGSAAGSSSPVSVFTRWREPRTLLVGFVVLAFALAEGSGNDWISVSLIDSYQLPASVGALGFAAFLAAMTTMRWIGTQLLDRFGRVTVVRAMAGLATVGLLLFVFGTVPPLAFVGVVLWGLGAALGFPVGMSAAADDPRAAAGRVSVVASIGYCAFLAGPPLIGFLGDHVTVLKGLMAVVVVLALAILATSALKPVGEAPSDAGPV